jgi:hypothetical protein
MSTPHTTPTGRRTDDYATEARAAFDTLNDAIRAAGLPFMLSTFRIMDGRGYPTFSVSMTATQAERLADAITDGIVKE